MLRLSAKAIDQDPGLRLWAKTIDSRSWSKAVEGYQFWAAHRVTMGDNLRVGGKWGDRSSMGAKNFP